MPNDYIEVDEARAWLQGTRSAPYAETYCAYGVSD